VVHLYVASAVSRPCFLSTRSKNDSVAEVENLLKLELKLLVSVEPVLKEATNRRLTLVAAQPSRRQVEDHITVVVAHHRINVPTAKRFIRSARKLYQIGGRGLLGHPLWSIPRRATLGLPRRFSSGNTLAVSPANLDLVRSILAAWERGDFSRADWAHPGIEFVVADGPAPGRWTGRGGMAEGARPLVNAWEDLRAVVEEYRELDNERVLVLVRRRGRGKTSGMELGQLGSKGADLFHVRDSKVTRIVAYWDRERAFADLGLTSEEPRDPR
jgi:ketosteroid isomerase-like protein